MKRILFTLLAISSFGALKAGKPTKYFCSFDTNKLYNTENDCRKVCTKHIPPEHRRPGGPSAVSGLCMAINQDMYQCSLSNEYYKHQDLEKCKKMCTRHRKGKEKKIGKCGLIKYK